MGDWDEVSGVRDPALPFALALPFCRGFAVCVEEEDAEESDGAGDVAREVAEDEGRDSEGSADIVAAAAAFAAASARSCRREIVYCCGGVSTAHKGYHAAIQ